MRFYYRVALIALFIVGIFTAQVVNAQTQPTSILIENVRIFDGKSAQLSAPSNLLVVGNKIETISTTVIATPTGEKVTRLNGGGRVLMPGLIDNHVHIVLSASSERELVDPQISEATIQSRATEEAKQMLLRGFTSVRDLSGPTFRECLRS